jgi:hypothetical protein
MRLIIPMIIQTIGLHPSGALWTDGASNVSRPDPSGADQIDAEHQATDLAVGVRPRGVDAGCLWPGRHLPSGRGPAMSTGAGKEALSGCLYVRLPPSWEKAWGLVRAKLTEMGLLERAFVTAGLEEGQPAREL